MSTRRDDRVEPDDDDATASRIDVVNVGGGGSGESAASGMVSLRRELAKLHQQAAAVEKSLEDQRRDRSEALDRSERAVERALQLEARLAGMESEVSSLRTMHAASLAELQIVRGERDDLALAVEGAKSATAELGRVKDEVLRLRSSAEESARASMEVTRLRAELAKERKATEIAEQDAVMVGEQATRVREEAARLRMEADTARAELAKVREQVKLARDDAETARTDAAKALTEAKNARDDATAARADVAKALEDAIAAHDDATKLREELVKARNEASRVGDDLSKTRAELSRAKEDNSRDRATARDKIDLLERALDDARATAARLEGELEAARANEERFGRELEAARQHAAQAEQRATSTATAHAALEQNVRRLREDIAGAFARAGLGAPPPPLPPKQIVSIPPEALDSVPPEPMSIPPAPVAHIPDASHDAVPRSLAELAERAERAHDESAPSSPASKSVPPPASASLTSASSLSIPTPTYASVPPQVHPEAAPDPAVAPLDTGARKTAPPPAHAEMPAAAVGSIPPPARSSTRPESGSLPPEHAWNDSSPPTRRPGGSAVPPPLDTELMSKVRQDLLVQLVDPDYAEEAAVALRHHPEWLRSVPPPTLVAALSSVDYDAEGAIFELARAWDREPLCHALIASLRSEPDARLREHTAWLLKHLAAPSSWKAIADFAKSEDEPSQLRRWLLEALDRLAAGRAIGWRELGDIVSTVARSPDATLRDGVVGILVSLDRSEEKRRLLLEILRTDDDEVVLASAVNALASVLPMDLEQDLMNRLLGHPSPRVQRSVRELVERVKHAKQ